MHAPGKIIVLNGPSAAGKSSIQKEFQKISNELYLTIGIDGFFDVILPEVDGNGISIKDNQRVRWVTCSHDENGNQLISLHVGELGHRVMRGMHRAIAAYAQQGCNVIVDYIAYDAQLGPRPC